jgi:hypothetical protein
LLFSRLFLRDFDAFSPAQKDFISSHPEPTFHDIHDLFIASHNLPLLLRDFAVYVLGPYFVLDLFQQIWFAVLTKAVVEPVK